MTLNTANALFFRLPFCSSSGSSTSYDVIDLKCLKRSKGKSKGRKKKARKTQQQPVIEAETVVADESIKDSGIAAGGESEHQQSAPAPNDDQSLGAASVIVEPQLISAELDEQLKGNCKKFVTFSISLPLASPFNSGVQSCVSTHSRLFFVLSVQLKLNVVQR